MRYLLLVIMFGCGAGVGGNSGEGSSSSKLAANGGESPMATLSQDVQMTEEEKNKLSSIMVSANTSDPVYTNFVNGLFVSDAGSWFFIPQGLEVEGPNQTTAINALAMYAIAH